MSTENFTYLNSLDVNLPASSDSLIETDDHIRGVKRALRNQFPSLGAAPVTATAAQLNSPFPIGAIVM